MSNLVDYGPNFKRVLVTAKASVGSGAIQSSSATVSNATRSTHHTLRSLSFLGMHGFKARVLIQYCVLITKCYTDKNPTLEKDLCFRCASRTDFATRRFVSCGTNVTRVGGIAT